LPGFPTELLVALTRASGSRGFGQQALEQLADLGTIPCDIPEEAAGDHPPVIEEIGRGQGLDAVFCGQGKIMRAIPDDRQVESLLFDDPLDFFVAELIGVDGHDGQGPIAVALGEGQEFGQLVEAWRAGHGPEVE